MIGVSEAFSAEIGYRKSQYKSGKIIPAMTNPTMTQAVMDNGLSPGVTYSPQCGQRSASSEIIFRQFGQTSRSGSSL